MDRIYEVRTFPRRTFHDLVILSRLAAWGLSPLPTAENLSHEKTTRRSKYRPHHFTSFISLLFFSFFFKLIFLVAGITIMRGNKEKAITSGDEDVAAPLVVQVTSIQTGKRKSKSISSAMDLDDLPSRRGAKK